MKEVQVPQNDDIVITTRIVGSKVRRILVDRGSTSDIIFFSAFKHMGINEKELNTPGSLIRLNGIEARTIRIMHSNKTFGEAPRQVVLKLSTLLWTLYHHAIQSLNEPHSYWYTSI